MPQRNRKEVNKGIMNTKYNLSNTLALISKLYVEMTNEI